MRRAAGTSVATVFVACLTAGGLVIKVPEPAALVLLGTGLMGLGLVRRMAGAC